MATQTGGHDAPVGVFGVMRTGGSANSRNRKRLVAACAGVQPQMSAPPLISFLVVVRNECTYIEACLTSMLNQTLSPELYEIIVVDGMSRDGTRDIIQRTIAAHPARAIRLFDNPGLILSCGWNIGIVEARGRYVIRPDAHAEVPSDFLERSLAVKQAHPEAVAVGGVLETVGRGFWGQTIAALRSSRIGAGNSRFRVGGAAGPAETVVFGLYERSELLEIGGFDESIPLNQDNVCHGRLRAAGKTLFFDPSIRSRFYTRASLPAAWKQQYRRSKWVILMLKHQQEGSFSPRYLAPLAAAALAAVLLLGGWLVSPLCWIVLAALAACHAFLALLTAYRNRLNFLQILAAPLALAVLHGAFASGSIAGLLRWRFYAPDASRMYPLRGSIAGPTRTAAPADVTCH